MVQIGGCFYTFHNLLLQQRKHNYTEFHIQFENYGEFTQLDALKLLSRFYQLVNIFQPISHSI